MGFSFMTVLVVVQRYFQDKLMLSCGVMYLGFEVGVTLLSPVVGSLLSSVGWQWTMCFLAGYLLSITVLCGIAFKELESVKIDYEMLTEEEKSVKDMDQQSYKNDQNSNLEISQEEDEKLCLKNTKPVPQDTANSWSNWLSIKTIMLMFAYVWFDIEYIVTFTFLPIKYQTLGISTAAGSWLIGLIGLSSVVVRAVAIITADKHFKVSLYLTSVSLFISGLATVLAPFYTEFWKLAIYCSLLGATLGNSLSVISFLLKRHH